MTKVQNQSPAVTLELRVNTETGLGFIWQLLSFIEVTKEYQKASDLVKKNIDFLPLFLPSTESNKFCTPSVAPLKSLKTTLLKYIFGAS